MSAPDRSLPPLVGALLVGGESRRFGRPKQLARLGGVTLGEHVTAALAAVAAEVVLAGGGEVAEELAGLPRVADAAGLRGPLAGIAGALAARPGRAVLAAACDQPRLDAAALSWLAGERRPGTLATLVRLAPGGIEPLPGIYEPELASEIATLARGGGSLQPLAARADVRVVRPPEALVAAWTSVDTPAELERFEAASRMPPSAAGDDTTKR